MITLSIEANKIKVLTLKGKGIEKWGSAPLEPGIVRDGLVLQPQALGQATQALLNEVGAPKGKVIISLSGLRSTFRILTLPKLKPDMVEEAIRRGAKKEMPVPLDELYLTWQPMGGKADGQEFFVLGVPREFVDAELQALAEPGIVPSVMDLKPLALARAIDRRDALIIDLEPDCFVMTLVAEGVLSIVRTITPKGGETTLEDNIRRLLGEISRTVQFCNREHPQSPLNPETPVFLTGELSADAAVTELIRAEIGYPVEPLAPPLIYEPTFPVASYAVNIGLALRGKGKKGEASNHFRDIQLNILDAKRKARHLPIGHLLLVFLVMIVTAGLPLAYQAKNEAGDKTARLQTEVDTIIRGLRQANLATEEEGKINDLIAQADAMEQAYRAIFASDSESRIIRLITDALPASAHLTSLTLGPEEITLSGVADSPSAVIGYALDLEQKGIFAEVSIVDLEETAFTLSLSRQSQNISGASVQGVSD